MLRALGDHVFKIRKALAAINLECTGDNDHDPPPCPKCVRIRTAIKLALEAQAQDHEACIAEIQAGQLVMVNRDNELHDEKDREIKRLREQAEIFAGQVSGGRLYEGGGAKDFSGDR